MNKYFSKEKLYILFHTISHPMDGYYWIRRKNLGSVPLAIVLVVAFSVSFSLNRYLASFVVNFVNPRDVNTLTELVGVLILYLLICVGNWSVTCLLNGEGRLKDIAITTGYATLPLTVTLLVATLLSQFIAKDEEAFYYIVIAIGIVWTFVMFLIGIMQIHGYSLGKTLLTLFLTLIAVFIIMFIGLLLIDLIVQVYNFFHSIYLEMIFRL